MLSRSLFSCALRHTARSTRPSTHAFTKPQLIRLTPSQYRSLSTETRAAIDQAVASNNVVLFMKGTPEMPQCGFSRASIVILSREGVDPTKFSAFNVLEDESLRQGIKEFSDWPTIPQLYLDKEFIGGCDILISMHKNGELTKLFEEKGVLVPSEDPPDKAPTINNEHI